MSKPQAKNRPQVGASALERGAPAGAGRRGVTRGRSLWALALAALVLALAGPARAAAGAGTPPGSRYPAAATRPELLLTRAQIAASRRHAQAARRRTRRRAKPALTGNPARALSSFQAMQRAYLIPGSTLYAGEPFSYLWSFSQALAATVTLANVPALAPAMASEIHGRLAGLRYYLDTNNAEAPEGTYTSTLAAYDGTVAPPAGPGGPKYYDDNDWVGIELARLYRLDRDPAVLASAQAIMNFEMAAWQEAPGLACPGGIPFSNAVSNTDRNTVTTAPAAELALQLYRLTGQAAYLEFAKRAYAWVRNCLLRADGLYADHISPRGAVEQTAWSYNQGTMIGAGALLYQATGEGAYLWQARQTAKAALARFTPQQLAAENPFFPAVFLRNLLYLDSITHDPPGPRLAQAYVDAFWQEGRLPSGIFVAGPPLGSQLLVQSSVTLVYGLLASSPSTYF